MPHQTTPPPPPYDPFDQDSDKGATEGEHQEDSSQQNKKSKTTNSTNATSSSSGPSTGPSPMQLSATPFGKGPIPPKRIFFSKANRQQQVAFTPLPKGPESGKGLQDRSIAQCMTNHGSPTKSSAVMQYPDILLGTSNNGAGCCPSKTFGGVLACNSPAMPSSPLATPADLQICNSPASSSIQQGDFGKFVTIASSPVRSPPEMRTTQPNSAK